MSEEIHGGLTAAEALINVLIDKGLKKGMGLCQETGLNSQVQESVSVDPVLDIVLPKPTN